MTQIFELFSYDLMLCSVGLDEHVKDLVCSELKKGKRDELWVRFGF